MKDLVLINGQEIQRVEYKGVPVVTMAMVDALHERKEGAAKDTFRRHKNKLVEGEDFFRVPHCEWGPLLNGDSEENQEVFGGMLNIRPKTTGNNRESDFGHFPGNAGSGVRPDSEGNQEVFGGGFNPPPKTTGNNRESVLPDINGDADGSPRKGGHKGEIVFFTKSGYLMIVKPFNDDLAWRIQRQLVTRYFEKPSFVVDRKKGKPTDFLAAVTKMCAPADKLLKGEASLRALHYFTGMPVDDLLKKLAMADQAVRAPRMDEISLIDFYLHALLSSGPERLGLQCGTDAEGRPYFLARAAQLVAIFHEIGKRRGLPAFPFSAPQFGARVAALRGELRALGWSRSEDPEKAVKGLRFYRYTFYDPEGPPAGMRGH